MILTGAGERAFSAGADIHEFSESVRPGANTAVRDFVRRGQAMTARLEAFRKPVIAAVNGLAFGGGCEITEAVHLAIASEKARFAKPEINLGMPPTFGGTQRLPRLAGRKRALELLLTGDPFTPARALEIGLVNVVVPHDALLPAARELAGRIVRHSPLAVGAIITAVTRGLNMASVKGCRPRASSSPPWCRPAISMKASMRGSSAGSRSIAAADATHPSDYLCSRKILTGYAAALSAITFRIASANSR